MWKDEIVEQVRAEREKIAARHGHDLTDLFRALRDAEKRTKGHEVVSLPPRPAVRAAHGAA